MNLLNREHESFCDIFTKYMMSFKNEFFRKNLEPIFSMVIKK